MRSLAQEGAEVALSRVVLEAVFLHRDKSFNPQLSHFVVKFPVQDGRGGQVNLDKRGVLKVAIISFRKALRVFSEQMNTKTKLYPRCVP